MMSFGELWARRASALAMVSLSVAGLAAQSSASLRSYVGRTVDAKVTTVVDGDTVHARLPNDTTIVVRLDGIDAPERGEPFGIESRNAARVLLFERQVELRGTDVDRYGRLVARVTVDGIDSSVQLVKAGVACHFTHYSSDPGLATAQTDARANGHGMWGLGAEQPACVRVSGAPFMLPLPRAVLTTEGGPFHGNTQSHLYHAASCPNYGCKNCTEVFASAAEAASAGFTPARDCIGRR